MKPERSLKERLAAGETLFGTFVNTPAGGLIEIMGHAGLDFVILDTEHGPLSIETCEELLRSVSSVGMSSIIRILSNEPTLAQRALDIGAGGVQVPQVQSRADAERAVQGAKYAPLGLRGLSTFLRAADYGAAAQGHTDRANAESLVVIHIEGRSAVEAIDDILTVEGVDVIFLGPYDLSQSVGVPGQVEHPQVMEMMRTVAEKTRAAGKIVGSFARDVSYARKLMELGTRYLVYGVDVGVYLEAWRERVAALRGSGH
jgi:4-hydroxy-2-oxoheptanedioate aldolase